MEDFLLIFSLEFLMLQLLQFIAHFWAFKEHPKVNQIQYNALKFFFSLGKASPIAALLGDFGWVPIQMRLEYALLKYWYRVCNLPQERLPKKVFIWAGKIADLGKKNWVSQVRLLLGELNLTYAFINAGNRKETHLH